MVNQDLVASALAAAFVGGRWQVDELVARGARALGRRWSWLRPLASRLLHVLGEDSLPSRSQIERFLLQDAGFQRACLEHAIRVGGPGRNYPMMSPAAGSPASWGVPPLVTVGELAKWLGLEGKQLDWFADRRSLERTTPAGPLRHYKYYWLSKRLGGSARLVEAPKWRLKMLQRRVLRGILDNIPPHAAAHGFWRGRSIRSFAAAHVGQAVVLRMDLKDFFPSIAKARIVAVFRTAGYPEDVCQLLAALCTNHVPDDVWQRFPQYGGAADRWRHEGLYARPHLPQGTPTSPALANLCAYRLDCRLTGLAHAVGGKYTRYADDLLFSGGEALARSLRRFEATACSVIIDEGFAVNFRKRRIMRQGVRQHATGLVLNRHVNVARDEYDRLKATLHNCVCQGPTGQNRGGVRDWRLHLQGRIAFVESINPDRGRRLRRLFDRIQWPRD